MYYFLTALSFLDAYYSSIIIPKIIINFLYENKTISFLVYATQMFLFLTCGATECFILATMAYNHYVAIYNPLLYLVKMSPRVYVPLIISCYVVGILHATLHTVATVTLSFCASNEIRHVFCNIIDFTNHDFSRKNRERKWTCCRKKKNKPTAITVIALKNSRALKALNNLHIQFIQ